MQPMKQAATNMAASAQSGMDKTKATVQEKVEKMTTKNPVEKEEAMQKKEAKIAQAEMEKQAARASNAPPGHNTGAHQPGHVTEGMVGSRPAGPNTVTGPTYNH